MDEKKIEDKIKKAIQLLAVIEELIVKLISVIGWLLILVKVIRG